MYQTECRAIWCLLRHRRGRFLIGVVLLGLQTAALLPIMFLVDNIFAVRIPASDSRGVLLVGLGMLALYILSSGLSLASRWCLLSAMFAALAELRFNVLSRLHELPLAWHEHRGAGQIHSAVVLDGDRLEACLPSLVALPQAVVVGLPLLVAAIVVSPLLSGVVVIITAAMLLLNAKLRSRTERSINRWIGSHRAYNARILRTLRSIHLIRTRGVDEVELEESGRYVTALARNGLAKSWALSISSALSGSIAGAVVCVILVVGGVGVTRGALTLSELLTFYAVVALMLRNVTAAAGSGGNLMTAGASLIPLLKIIDDPLPPVYQGTRQERFDGSIALNGVTFGYEAVPVLREIDFEIGPGERVAVTGSNGSGKSTLARLVLGVDRPWTGTVSASGYPLEEIDVAALCRQIGVVSQESYIRPGTIRDNVTFGRSDLSETDVAHALSLACVGATHDDRFPDDIGTDVGDDGARLSGGQRQAISIARALVGDPRLLILDEPTNHLDASSVQRLLAAVDSMDPAPAVLLITHDRELARWADREVRIEDGRLRAAQTMPGSA